MGGCEIGRSHRDAWRPSECAVAYLLSRSSQCNVDRFADLLPSGLLLCTDRGHFILTLLHRGELSPSAVQSDECPHMPGVHSHDSLLSLPRQRLPLTPPAHAMPIQPMRMRPAASHRACAKPFARRQPRRTQPRRVPAPAPVPAQRRRSSGSARRAWAGHRSCIGSIDSRAAAHASSTAHACTAWARLRRGWAAGAAGMRERPLAVIVGGSWTCPVGTRSIARRIWSPSTTRANTTCLHASMRRSHARSSGCSTWETDDAMLAPALAMRAWANTARRRRLSSLTSHPGAALLRKVRKTASRSCATRGSPSRPLRRQHALAQSFRLGTSGRRYSRRPCHRPWWCHHLASQSPICAR